MRRGAAGNRYGVGLSIASLLLACTFGTDAASGGGDDEDGQTEGAATTGTAGAATTTGTDTSPSDGDDADDDDDDDDTTPSDSTGPGDDDDDDDDASTGDPVDCGATYHVEAWASDAAVVEAPMTVGPGWTDMDAQVAYTAQDDGTVTFVLDIPCAGPHYAWALVWDRFRGGNSCGAEHADSFFFAVDGGGYDGIWAYGCENCNGNDSDWYWARVSDYSSAVSCSGGETIAPEFDAGNHTLSFRGREDGSFVLPEPDVSAMVGVVVSNDPDFDLSSVVIP